MKASELEALIVVDKNELAELQVFTKGSPTVSQEFRANRLAFPAEELARYRGQWVAFSADGRRIIAAAKTMERLEEELAVVDRRSVVLEHIPNPDEHVGLGGQEL